MNGNQYNFSSNAHFNETMKGSSIGTEVCTVIDGDPTMDIEAMRRYAPENGISTKYLLTGQRKRAEPYQSIMLNQQEPVVQPTGTYNVVNTSAFGSGEPTLENLQNGQGSIPGYKRRFPQMLDRPGPAEMVPKHAGGELRGIDVNDYDSRDPVSGKAPKNYSVLGSEVEMQQKVDQIMQSYQQDNNVNAQTLPFQASNWAVFHPELVNTQDGNIPVYDTNGNVIQNIKAKVDDIPLPSIPSPQQQQNVPAPSSSPTTTMAMKQARAHHPPQHVHPSKNKKKNTIGFILIVLAGVIILGILITVIVASSSSSSSSSKTAKSSTRTVPEPVSEFAATSPELEILAPQEQSSIRVPGGASGTAGYYF